MKVKQLGLSSSVTKAWSEFDHQMLIRSTRSPTNYVTPSKISHGYHFRTISLCHFCITSLRVSGCLNTKPSEHEEPGIVPNGNQKLQVHMRIVAPTQGLCSLTKVEGSSRSVRLGSQTNLSNLGENKWRSVGTIRTIRENKTIERSASNLGRRVPVKPAIGNLIKVRAALRALFNSRKSS